MAATVGYWRMEADSPAPGFDVLNEIGGGSPMTSTNAQLDFFIPVTPIPQTGATNLSSVFRVTSGGANGINGTIAHYAALDSASVTIEFWASTTEGEAALFHRATGANRNTLGTDGVSMVGTNSLALRYYVDTGGAGTAVDLTNLNNFDGSFDHFAFTYDAPTGVGKVFINGSEVASNDGPDGIGLLWGTSVAAAVGDGQDGGRIDELRISDQALASSQFLNAIPEPSTALLAMFGASALLFSRRRR